jgi:2-keto-4-pentenoate hydratase/2-oxohepta-3-ene-1,7-dioic acid hydratase in catechol pathway
MKLVTYTKANAPKSIGIWMEEYILDLPSAATEFKFTGIPADMKTFLETGRHGMAAAREIQKKVNLALEKGKKAACLVPAEKVKLLPPVDKPEKIICIGQNYIDHCREQGVKPPEKPIIFAKFWNALNGPYDPVLIPSVSDKIDYEAELAFVIGKKAKGVSREKAMNYVAGYMVMNDITARDIQKSDGQWIRGKTSDTFAPCGPWLTTRDEVKDPHVLPISLKVNGKIMQNSNTSNLIFNIPYLIWFITQNITLQPGDIISTGTPPGVGFTRIPPVFLKPGDVVEAEVGGLGALCNKIK